ncbi:hypothetical protein B0H11DRAFT_1716106 [Mycena galericulata]|nr:hypothetical protein B0H11DRAFT_1716106 [Mycena galericulata]
MPPNIGEYIRVQLNLPAGLPVSLWSIPDDGGKPSLSWADLSKLAIFGSEEQRLTFRGICEVIIDRFEWFRARSTDRKWRNCISNTLTSRREFRLLKRSKRAGRDIGYWSVDFSHGEGRKPRQLERGPAVAE